MIIVSQDEDIIVNFDKVDNIKFRKLPANENGYAISIETTISNFDRFAIYDTPKRAIQVFGEIIKQYEGCNRSGFGFVANEVFYMPKE